MSAVQFDPSSITKIYYGRDSGCRCGCHGRYVAKGERSFDLYLKKFTEELAAADESMVDADKGSMSTYINVSLPNNKARCAYFD